MRRILATCLLLAIALPCQAQGDKPKPNTLTPKDIADGWILLFDGETTFGWQGTAKAEEGFLVVEGRTVTATTSMFQCFELIYEYQVRKHFSEDILIVVGEFLQPLKGPEKNETWQGRVVVGDRIGDALLHEKACEMILSHQGKIVSNKYGTLRNFHQFPGKKNQNPVVTISPMTMIAFSVPGSAIIAVRNIKLRPLNTKSLFNGKDLDGWKEFPGKKSKFAVIDGAINVKDGPGDLQTVGKYKDFVLQLDCISHGKHLNSGIFFRCRDGEYQNGYEAQIRNEFTEKASQKYLIEEYDPKTNKLIGKKEQLFTAVDYGTGAIYRRQPARKQMSKDGEWFTMTIVAHGNHFATWVNGIQVTDWTDNRPKTDNARTGCKLEAGHLSIQGHDPTTNLSFKNFRIAELK